MLYTFLKLVVASNLQILSSFSTKTHSEYKNQDVSLFGSRDKLSEVCLNNNIIQFLLKMILLKSIK